MAWLKTFLKEGQLIWPGDIVPNISQNIGSECPLKVRKLQLPSFNRLVMAHKKRVSCSASLHWLSLERNSRHGHNSTWFEANQLATKLASFVSNQPITPATSPGIKLIQIMTRSFSRNWFNLTYDSEEKRTILAQNWTERAWEISFKIIWMAFFSVRIMFYSPRV